MLRSPCNAIMVLWKRRYAHYLLNPRVFGAWDQGKMVPPENWRAWNELHIHQKDREVSDLFIQACFPTFATFLACTELVFECSAFWWGHFLWIPGSKHSQNQHVLSVPTLPEDHHSIARGPKHQLTSYSMYSNTTTSCRHHLGTSEGTDDLKSYFVIFRQFFFSPICFELRSDVDLHVMFPWKFYVVLRWI